MRLAIVGSRELTEEQERLALTICLGMIQYYDPSVVISGGAEGIDTIAEQAATQLKVPFKKYLPTHPQWTPQGYKERNLEIVASCDYMLCIRNAKARTYGSGWTAEQADLQGKVVLRVIF